MSELATVSSKPLGSILERMDHRSINFSAEVLGKTLAYGDGEAGTIANGSAAICAYEASHHVAATCHDGSGLSYANRVSTNGLVGLLSVANHEPWGAALRSTLPTAGAGTLAGRLTGLRIRAKTGTLLQRVSALSGWVWLQRSRHWAEFAILSRGLAKSEAVTVEDELVSIVAQR
jgi:serine-type D-Ala-D-Ala carboxypeptidase/endopeptidase (penicillin-binding protein 4)